MTDKNRSLEQRLENFPNIKASVESLLDAVEDRNGDFDRADDIEQYMIEQMRVIAKDSLGEWAVGKEEKQAGEFLEETADVKNQGKKSSGGIRRLEKST